MSEPASASASCAASWSSCCSAGAFWHPTCLRRSLLMLILAVVSWLPLAGKSTLQAIAWACIEAVGHRMHRYLENVPTIVPLLEREFRSAAAKLSETQVHSDCHDTN